MDSPFYDRLQGIGIADAVLRPDDVADAHTTTGARSVQAASVSWLFCSVPGVPRTSGQWVLTYVRCERRVHGGPANLLDSRRHQRRLKHPLALATPECARASKQRRRPAKADEAVSRDDPAQRIAAVALTLSAPRAQTPSTGRSQSCLRT